MMNVQIVLFDGFDLLDAVAPYEVFCAAAMYADKALSVELVTAEGQRAVPSGINGVELVASGRLNPDQQGIILVPGASGDIEGEGPNTIPAILGRAMRTELTGLVGQALERGDTTVATVCGGSLVLAMGGLLEGRPAVTNHLGMGLLEASGAIPISARVVDDGNLVSGGGVTSGLDVALYLVERELGPRIAHKVEQLFEFERRGTVWRNTGIEPYNYTTSASTELNTAPGPAAYVSPNHDITRASVFEGIWDTTIATPVGRLQIKLSIHTHGGLIQGTATQGDETVEFINPRIHNHKLVWSLRITKPMRLNLKFEVSTDGERIDGVAKAGILPASRLNGHRVS